VHATERWKAPATREQVAQAVMTTTALVEPAIDDSRLQALVAFLASEDYSEAEIAYAARELPKDEHLDAKMRYGKPLTPADFERIISRVRSLRKVLSQQRIPEKRMDALINEVPELCREDFGQMGFDVNSDPVYTIKADARERLEGGQS
jgi:hypothetical protein